jgi:hypothetical protein
MDVFMKKQQWLPIPGITDGSIPGMSRTWKKSFQSISRRKGTGNLVPGKPVTRNRQLSKYEIHIHGEGAIDKSFH